MIGEDDDGAVSSTDNPSALQRWIVGGPEGATVFLEYEETLHGRNFASSYLYLNRDETACASKAFRDVRSFFNTIKEVRKHYLSHRLIKMVLFLPLW